MADDRQAQWKVLMELLAQPEKVHDPASGCGCRVCALERLADAEEWDTWAQLFADGMRSGNLVSVVMELAPPEQPPGRRHLIAPIGSVLDERAPDFITLQERHVIEALTAELPGQLIAAGHGACRAVLIGAAVQPASTTEFEIVTR